MRVEEDWEIILNEPDANVNAPQFHTAMSPFSNADSLFIQITWNYQEVPDASAGGLQIQAWHYDNLLAKKNVDSDKMSTSAETVTWTQVLRPTGSYDHNSIENGQSTTWGTFGGPTMSLAGGFPLANLNDYTPEFSVANSWITYGDNRVELLRIKEVRYYDGSGNLISTDSTPKEIFNGND